MATASNHLTPDIIQGPSASGYRFGLVVSEWNSTVTEALLQGALETLLMLGATAENIHRIHVPGSFELPLGAQWMAEKHQPDAVICLGCVIQGETRHFDFICDATAQGIMRLNLDLKIPVVFGVLTTENQEQALDRSGGKYGNKGVEAALTAVKMVSLKKGTLA